MDLKEITANLSKISDIYAEKFNINRDNDWFVLKIQEELGELTAAHLKLSKRARLGDATQTELEKNLRDEIADVIALTLLYAKDKNVDVELAIKEKWFKYL
ncbi:MAG: hypothetical protein JNL11_12020 [Bdellovibrionaceae bacterium]|nr:hypothetical protein [Pseudobdellovibrionaceae bacterium]